MKDNLTAIREAMRGLYENSKQYSNLIDRIIFNSKDIIAETDKAYLIRIKNSKWKVWLAKRYVISDLNNDKYIHRLQDFNYKIFKNNTDDFNNRIEYIIDSYELKDMFLFGIAE